MPVTGVFVGVVLIAALLAWRVIQNVYLSPLRHIPGPFIAKITGKWLVMVDLAGNRTSTIHGLHKKYGGSVRIGPNEVSFSNIESVKEIYGMQTVYMKAPVYDTFSVPPMGIFSMRDKYDHSQRRKLLSHAFAQANLYDTEPLIRQLVQKLLDRISNSSGKPIDMLSLFRMLALDIVGELFLGRSFEALDHDNPPAFLEDVDMHFLLSGLDANFPWLYLFLSKLPIPAVRHFFAARQRLIQYGRKAFESYLSRYGRKSGRKDLLTKILTVKTDSGEPPLTDRETYTEISNLVFAGTDTTSTTLTYLFWELCRNPTWQDRLFTELEAHASVDDLDKLSYRDLTSLPVLDALVNEALRLHPAAPASLQRVAPKGGSTINAYTIPEDTVVSMQCYTTQRDPSSFPDPDTFSPSRWLQSQSQGHGQDQDPSAKREGGEGATAEMKELFMPFSKGPRACLGKNLALMELKLVTAAVILRYKVGLAPGTTDDSMAMKDHFLVLPRRGRCDLILEERRVMER